MAVVWYRGNHACCEADRPLRGRGGVAWYPCVRLETSASLGISSSTIWMLLGPVGMCKMYVVFAVIFLANFLLALCVSQILRATKTDPQNVLSWRLPASH